MRTRARYPTALPIHSQNRTATTKIPAAMYGSSGLFGWGAIHRVSGGAITAPTTAPTTRPTMARPPQVNPRRYPEKEKATTRSTIRMSRRSISAGF